MRPGLRAIFFLSVIPCVPVVIALMYWVMSSSCPGHLAFTDTPHPIETFSHNRWTGNVSVVNVKNEVSNKELLLLSEHEDIEQRGKFQQERVRLFCQHYFMTKEREYPTDDSLRYFYRHLMFDDPHKVIFCFVPKVGCTNLKRLMLYMGGHLPENTIDWPWVDDSTYLEPALRHASLMNKTLTDKEKSQRIKEYFKFMVVRNPLERLVSGYRNKLEAPVRSDRQNKFPDYIKIAILTKYRKAELKYWQLTNSRKPSNISVTFAEFIRYLVDSGTTHLNEHFQPMMDICHPCLIKYNFYGNFRNISHDVRSVIAKLKTNPRFYRDESLHSNQEQTNVLMAKYYRSLSQRDKVQLLGLWYDEILFYYTLYPSERDSHRQLLGIDIPIV